MKFMATNGMFTEADSRKTLAEVQENKPIDQ